MLRANRAAKKQRSNRKKLLLADRITVPDFFVGRTPSWFWMRSEQYNASSTRVGVLPIDCGLTQTRSKSQDR